MIKLPIPDHLDYSALIDNCCKTMNKNSPYKNKILENKDALIRVSNFYIKCAKENNLFKHRHFCLCNDDNILIAGNSNVTPLKNHEMVKLYDTYFRDNRCGGIYDKLINDAQNPHIGCTFCGGVGNPCELDHFLPKAQYGYYSILPVNLIPCCKECNQIFKGGFFPVHKNEQLIHPYLDEECYFKEQWLFARCSIDKDPPTIEYYVFPPEHWSDDKKNKVKFHFSRFDLNKKFSKIASPELSYISYYKKIKWSEREFMDFIDSKIEWCEEYYKQTNHWIRALYFAIKEDITQFS